MLTFTLCSLSACAQDHYHREQARSPSETEPSAPQEEPSTPPVAVNEQDPEPASVEPPTLKRELCAIRKFDSLAPAANTVIVAPCTYRIVDWPLDIYPRFTELQVGERILPYGEEADGWTNHQGKRDITLLGAACDDALNGTSITVSFECMTADPV